MLDFVFEYNYRVLVTLNVHEIQGAGNPEKNHYSYAVHKPGLHIHWNENLMIENQFCI